MCCHLNSTRFSFFREGLVKFGLVVSSVLILCNYYYLYFFSFDQGASYSGFLNLLRIFSLSVFYYLILSRNVKSYYNVDELIFLLFLLCASVIFFVKRGFYENGDLMFFNLIICSVPILIFKFCSIKRLFFFFDACLVVLTFQVALDFFIYFKGFSLWENKAFVGGVGNPSSFGIICNFFTCYILFYKKITIRLILCFFVLFFGVVMTSSLLSVCILMVIVFFKLFQLRKIYFFSLFFLLCFVFIFFHEIIFTDHVVYKLRSLFGVFDFNQNSSLSVSLRILIHSLFLEQLSLDFFDLFYAGFDNFYYKGVDSQYLTYFFSFGVIFGLLFLVAMIASLVSSLKSICIFGFFPTIGIFIFIFTFFFNRLLDYYPVALFLFLIISISSYQNRSQY